MADMFEPNAKQWALLVALVKSTGRTASDLFATDIYKVSGFTIPQVKKALEGVNVSGSTYDINDVAELIEKDLLKRQIFHKETLLFLTPQSLGLLDTRCL